MLLLVDNLKNETTSSKKLKRDRGNFESVRARYLQFSLVLQFCTCVLETALVFSQSEARIFFMFIINQESLNQKAYKRLRTHSFNKVRLFLFKVVLISLLLSHFCLCFSYS